MRFYHILKEKKIYKITLSFLYLLITGLCSWCSSRFIYDGFGLFHCRNLEKSFRSYGAFLTTRFPWLGAFSSNLKKKKKKKKKIMIIIIIIRLLVSLLLLVQGLSLSPMRFM